MKPKSVRIAAALDIRGKIYYLALGPKRLWTCAPLL